MPMPMANGRMMPPIEMIPELLAFRLMTSMSISRPTKNKKRTSPIVAVRLRYGLDSSGKMRSAKPGTLPITVGPSTMLYVGVVSDSALSQSTPTNPHITSAMTFGCLILRRPKANICVVMMMMPE